MYKKNIRLFILMISNYLYSYESVLAYIKKLFVFDYHAPGAQGGTGGW